MSHRILSALKSLNRLAFWPNLGMRLLRRQKRFNRGSFAMIKVKAELLRGEILNFILFPWGGGPKVFEELIIGGLRYP